MRKLPLTDLPLSSWNVSGSWNYTETAVSRLFLLTEVLWNCCKLQNLQQLFLNLSLTFPLLLLFEQCWKKCTFATSRLSLVLLCIRRCLFVFVTQGALPMIDLGWPRMPTGQSTSWQPSLSPTTIATFSSSAKIHTKPDKIPNFTPQLSSLFWGLPRWTELDKKYPFQPALQFHRNWQDLSCSAREKEIGNFSPLTWRGALFHLGIFASCYSCAGKETISSLSSLKVAAQ